MRELRTALIVEDNRISRMILREILEGYGVVVREAVDGVQALELIEQEPPDLVISDILMPRCDGFKLADHIRETKTCPPIVLFLITAVYKGRGWEREARSDHHAQEYLLKPIEPADLEAALRRHFELPSEKSAASEASTDSDSWPEPEEPVADDTSESGSQPEAEERADDLLSKALGKLSAGA